jgi:hypothetical protein
MGFVESFLLFCQTIPSRDLGMVDSKADTLELSLAGRDLVIHQSLTLLSSNRKQGTTGSAVWGVTPRFAEWIVSSKNFLIQNDYLTSDSIVLELGCGVAGIVALMLAPTVGHYLATDQEYVMRILRRNIDENTSPAPARKSTTAKTKKKQPETTNQTTNITLLPLDWESSSVAHLPAILEASPLSTSQQNPAGSGIDALLACDCIYNEALIDPFVSTCAEICQLRNQESLRPTVCVVAQQLRSPDVFEAWLKRFHRSFRVWRVPDELLTPELQENSGFVVHVGEVRD